MPTKQYEAPGMAGEATGAGEIIITERRYSS